MQWPAQAPTVKLPLPVPVAVELEAGRMQCMRSHGSLSMKGRPARGGSLIIASACHCQAVAVACMPVAATKVKKFGILT